MQVWAEIHDGSEMFGIVKLSGATITRRLDAAGAFEIGTPPTDYVVNTHLRIGRRVRIKGLIRGQERVLMEGRVLSRRLANRVLFWSGLDGADELIAENTLVALIFNDTPMIQAVRELVRLTEGWDVQFQGEVDGFVTRRFDGESIMAALRWITETYGYHFRVVTDERRIVFGKMGTVSGLRIIQTGRMTRELERMRDMALLSTEPELLEEAHDIENWLLPMMGPVEHGLTLERSDKSSPFVIETMTGHDGRTLYFIQNGASVAVHGARKKVFQPRQLVLPVEATAQGVQNVANLLYDAAANRLKLYGEPFKSFGLNVAKLDMDIQPGETVNLVYKGIIRHHGQVMQYEDDIDADLWVMQVQEAFSAQGAEVALTVATVDRYPTDPAKLLVENMRKVEQARTQQVLTVERNKETDTVTISPTTTDSMTFEIEETTAWIASARVILTRLSAATGPTLVTMTLDGVEVGGLLFGSTTLVEEIDITASIQTASGVHTLAFSCQDGSGDIDVEVHLVEVLIGIGV